MCLDSKVSVSADEVSGVPQGSVIGPLLFIFYALEFFHIVENPMAGYADDTTILSRFRGLKWCNC